MRSRACRPPCPLLRGWRLPARGGRPAAMDGRRNGHGRGVHLVSRPWDHERCALAGSLRRRAVRVTPKRQGEPIIAGLADPDGGSVRIDCHHMFGCSPPVRRSRWLPVPGMSSSRGLLRQISAAMRRCARISSRVPRPARSQSGWGTRAQPSRRWCATTARGGSVSCSWRLVRGLSARSLDVERRPIWA